MRLKPSIKRKIIIFIIIVLFIVGIVIYLKCFDNKKKTKSKITNEIKEYNYVLKDSQSSEYKDEFDNLKKILSSKNIKEEDYVKSISKLFVIDFYTLDNKIAKTDVGGKQFVHKEALDNFLIKSQDTIYKYVENNLYGERKQVLPHVKDTNVTKINKVSYSYKDKKDDNAYEVVISWEYKKGTAEGYQKSATLYFVHEAKQLFLVELK